MTWVPTHCDPTQPVVSQLRVPAVPGFGHYADPGSPRRGVIIFFPGLNTLSFDRVAPPNVTYTRPVTTAQTGADDIVGTYVPSYGGSLSANLANDGWVLFTAAHPEVGYTSLGPPPNSPGLGLINDVANDSAFGARYLATFKRWIDHVIEWVGAAFGSGIPILALGGSHGGWSALQFIAYAGERLAGGIAFIPATIWMNASQVWTTPCNFNDINTTGMDIPVTLLNSIPSTLPVLIGYGTSDSALGWSQSSVAAGSNNANVALWTSANGTLNVVDATHFTKGSATQWGTNTTVYGPCVMVTTSTGFAIVMYSDIDTITNQLTGCTTVQGSGTLATGNAVVQNLVTGLITTAQGAGRDVTANATTDNHTLGMLSAGQYFPLAGPTALSSLGTLTLNDNVVGALFSSGQMAVYASDHKWHTVSFTGNSTTTVDGVTVTTLTGCTYSGDNTATLSLGAPICATGNPQSFLYFISQNIDPNCPAIY